VGLDAEDKGQAEAFALDANSLVMAGGSFMPFDLTRLWDPSKAQPLLVKLGGEGNLPVSVDGDVLDFLLNQQGDGGETDATDGGGHGDEHSVCCPKCGHIFNP
jgi:hypothetical protein